jgi:ElaB/YqjD/DUF883 family membrane-anchored ribosome-binding protein
MDDTLNRDEKQTKDNLPRVGIYQDDANVTKPTENEQRWVNTNEPTNETSYQYPLNASSPDALEEDINQTQERIAENIDELTKRLNPGRVKDQALQSVNESLNIKGLQHLVNDLRTSVGEGVKASGVKVLEGVKHSPLSAALIGAGAGAIAVGGVMAARTNLTTGSYSAHDERLRDMMQTMENSNTSSLRQNVSQKISQTSHDLQDSANHTVRKAKDGLGQLLESQPLAVGAVALLAGAAIGLLLPRTRYEDSLMGERSDHLISQAKSKASEVADVAKSTAQDVMQSAKDTVGEVVQTAKDTAKETAKAATS